LITNTAAATRRSPKQTNTLTHTHTHSHTHTNGQLTLIRRQHAVTFDVVLVKSGCGSQSSAQPTNDAIVHDNMWSAPHTLTHTQPLHYGNRVRNCGIN